MSHAALLVGATPMLVALVAAGGGGGSSFAGDALVLASLVLSAAFTWPRPRRPAARPSCPGSR